jgi:hypothetical protein
MPFKKNDPNINRSGRPVREISIPFLLKGILDADDQKAKKEILQNVVNLALEGERWAVEFIANRLEGTPIATVRTQEIDKDEVIDI